MLKISMSVIGKAKLSKGKNIFNPENFHARCFQVISLRKSNKSAASQI